MGIGQFLSRTRLKPIGAVALAVFAVVGLFQNCGTYEPLDNPLYAQSESSACIASSCAKDLNYLSLVISNSDPILITRNTERAIDLGGYCDAGGYPDSKIYAELKSGTNVIIAPYLTAAKCDDNGRFHVLLELPATFDYNFAYSIILTFRAVDANGNEYDHPTGVNRREINLLTAP